MATEDARKLFVAGLPESITEDALREVFEATGGKVTDVSLPRDRATGRVRGFGFVTFASSEEGVSTRLAILLAPSLQPIPCVVFVGNTA